MADDDCIVLGDSDDELAAPAPKRARGAAGADGDVELVDAQPAPLLASADGDSGDEDDDVRVVGTKGEVRESGPSCPVPRRARDGAREALRRRGYCCKALSTRRSSIAVRCVASHASDAVALCRLNRWR